MMQRFILVDRYVPSRREAARVSIRHFILNEAIVEEEGKEGESETATSRNLVGIRLSTLPCFETRHLTREARSGADVSGGVI